MRALPALFFTSILAVSGSVHAVDAEQEWKFRVLLDDTPIGSQTFKVRRDRERTRVSIEASFDIKFLFFTAYSYRHRNEEVWQGNCLRSMRSTTDDNGELFEVSAKDDGAAFVVETKKARTELPACPVSFAYWNFDALRAPRLLNSQTGDYLDVTMRELGTDTICVRGAATSARRVSLEGDKLRIQLGYSSDDEWLALESMTAGGRKLRFDRE
jgi:hypothetical protein